MSAIRSKDTTPEIILRRGLHASGLRYRLHVKSLPGSPDLVFPRYRAAVFVNGCFWHGHECEFFKWPQTRQEFWKKKILGNVERDKKNTAALHEMNWRIVTVWECALRRRHGQNTEVVVSSIAEWIKHSKEHFFATTGTSSIAGMVSLT